MREWRAQAKCKTLPSREADRLFFPKVTAPNPHVVLFCSSCIVQNQCLGYGILYKEQGYWGGLNLKQRQKMRPRLLAHLMAEALLEGPLESRNLDEFIGSIERGEQITSPPENLIDKVERLLADNKRFISELITGVA